MARYEIPESVLLSHLGDETVLLNLDTKRYFRLNATAAAIVRGVERGLGTSEIAGELCAGYEVTPEVADAEVARLMEELTARELVAARSAGAPA